MDCKTFAQRLETYLARDLAPDERAEMENHQAACVHCREATERATRLNGLLHDSLSAAAVMTPQERVALREGVLGRANAPRPTFRRGWTLRLAGLAAALAIVIAASSILWGRESVSPASAAEIIAHAQAAMDAHGMDGVLHWETLVEQWSPWSEIFYYEREIWFDFDDPGRYHSRSAVRGQSHGHMASFLTVCDGVARMWIYGDYVGEESVDEVIFSSDEMRERALVYKVPFPFRNDLASFADILPDVELAGETTVAGRRAYLLKGQLFTYEQNSMRETPRPITSTVTLIVDAETYWVLGQEEMVEGEERARTIYRTLRFELLPQGQVSQDTFTFTPPEGVQIRRLEGMDAFYDQPRVPSLTLEEAAAATPFVFLIPTTVPDDLELLPRVLMHQTDPDRERPEIQYQLTYRGKGTWGMTISEFTWPRAPAGAARLVDVGGRQGWLEWDLFDSSFAIYLPDWDMTVLRIPQDPDDRRPPGLVVLRAEGLTVEEAIAVLESLEPYVP